MPSSSNPFQMKHSRHSIELANADIYRLMDPSYHPHSSSSSSAPARAYVDRRGEMHDPDFHYFPVSTGRSTRSRRGRRVSDLARSEDELEDELEEEEYEYESRQIHRRQSYRRPRSPQSSTVHPSIYSVSSSSPSSSLSSSPSSFSSPLPISSLSGDKPHHHNHLLKKLRRRSVGSTSSFDYDSYDDFTDPEEVDSDQGHSSGAEVVERSHTDFSQTMKKQWTAVSLSLSIQLFRAKRRASSCTRSRKLWFSLDIVMNYLSCLFACLLFRFFFAFVSSDDRCNIFIGPLFRRHSTKTFFLRHHNVSFACLLLCNVPNVLVSILYCIVALPRLLYLFVRRIKRYKSKKIW